MAKELTAKQQAYLDSLADDAPDDDGEPEELEWQGKRYRIVTEEPPEDDGKPKVVKRRAAAPKKEEDEPAPKRRRFVT